MDLEQALGQFDVVETNLRRLEEVWGRLIGLIPPGISFASGTPEGRQYEDLRRAFSELADSLPAIGEWQMESRPMALDEIAQARLDADGVFEAEVSIEQDVHAPAEEISEYRYRFNRARQKLVRERVRELIQEVDELLAGLSDRVERDSSPVGEEGGWRKFVAAMSEIERLVGNLVRRTGRWRDLSRHISFAQGVDAHDIATADWPSVRADIEAALYGEFEPMPVAIDDLASVVESRPQGSVTTKLMWESLDAEGFERLIYNIIRDAPGYENPRWLTHTNAPDRGRDLSVERIESDALSGTTRRRVILQCKHWMTKSIQPTDVSDAVTAMALWEPPPVDVLIIATSGRFTSDAVSYIEKHNEARKQPSIDPWPDSHLESLLAQRPALVSAFRLRSAESGNSNDS